MEGQELKYETFPNEDGALTKEAAREIRAQVAYAEREINEIIEENKKEETQIRI